MRYGSQTRAERPGIDSEGQLVPLPSRDFLAQAGGAAGIGQGGDGFADEIFEAVARVAQLALQLGVRKPHQRTMGKGMRADPHPGAVELAQLPCPSPRDERRDRIEKLDEYAAFGVSWYWIIDPRLQLLEIFELAGGRYARAARATEGRLGTVRVAMDCNSISTTSGARSRSSTHRRNRRGVRRSCVPSCRGCS